MPDFLVTDPEGGRYKITAPDFDAEPAPPPGAESMTHGPLDPAKEEVGRRVRQTGENLYEHWIAPAEHLGKAAMSGTLDVTDPKTANEGLSVASMVMGGRMPFARTGELGVAGGRLRQPTGPNLDRPSFDTYARALTGHPPEAMSPETRAHFAERYAQRYGQQPAPGRITPEQSANVSAAGPGRPDPIGEIARYSGTDLMPIREFSVQRTGFTPDQLTDAQVRQLHREYNQYQEFMARPAPQAPAVAQPQAFPAQGRQPAWPPGTAPMAAPAIVGKAQDIFGSGLGSEKARAQWETHFQPHFPDQKQFINDYFAGYLDPKSLQTKYVTDEGPGVRFKGEFRDKGGNYLGNTTRDFFPDGGLVHHDLLSLTDEKQASGFVKQLAVQQMAVYKQMGIQRIDMLANLEIGGYAWAKYGYLPQSRYYTDGVIKRANYLIGRGLLDRNYVEDVIVPVLRNGDRRGIWTLADITHPFDGAKAGTFKEGYFDIKMDYRTNTVGKGLLVGQSWNADFRLANPEQMTRFDDYVARGTAAGTRP